MKDGIRPRLLWIGDICVPTGFARVTTNILQHLSASYDIQVCGINYLGEPHPYPYPIFPAWLQGDQYGVQRYRALIQQLQPDIVLVLHDPWVVAAFIAEHEKLPPWPEAERPPLVAYMPVDGLNVADAPALNMLDLAIAYTKFGAQQLCQGGYAGPLTVIQHGVDWDIYRPHDKAEAREHLGMPHLNEPGTLVIGNVNRNQPRKRLDLTLMGFAEWLHGAEYHAPERAFLWLHSAEKDVGCNLHQLAQYLDIEDRVIFAPPELTTWRGVEEAELPWLYSAWDIQLSTTLGEGWGLSTLESMACGVPNLVPCWSALAEWPKGCVAYMPCNAPVVLEHNNIGCAVIPSTVAKGLDILATDVEGRVTLAHDGLVLARQPQFHWQHIAARFDAVLRLALAGRSYEVTIEEEKVAHD